MAGLKKLPVLLLILGFVFLSCNLPAMATQTPTGVSALYTSAAQTVQAQLSEAVSTLPEASATSPGETPVDTPAPSATPTSTPEFTSTFTATSLPPTATSTPIPPPTHTPIPCNLVKFVEDVTIPDNTEVDPGQEFNKVWRLKNAGSCTWTTDYTLVPVGNNIFNAPAAVPLHSNVPPGGTIDISVRLKAPMTAGVHRGNFMLANGAGQRFGWGDGSKAFWAQVKVVVPGGIVFDFIALASSAEWKSGVGNNFNTPLTFNGMDTDPNGVAKIKEGVWLENGSISGKVLLMFPKHEANGIIGGLFSPFLVQNGDVFKARLGFLAEFGGICGLGQVIFELQYKLGGAYQSIGQWTKSCDGALLPITVSLSSLRGQTVQFLLIVRAMSNFQDDWAIWSSPRVER